MAIASNRLRNLRGHKRTGNNWGRYRTDYVFYYFLSVCDAAYRAAGYRMPEHEVIDNERISIKYNLFV